MRAPSGLPFPSRRRLRPDSPFRAIVAAAKLGACIAPILVATFVLAPAPAHAEKADRDKPTQVESDRMQYDDLKQVNVFTGNVVLTKGTILLRADRLVVRQDADGFQYATATGDLAHFRQKRDGPGDQYIEGQARRIDYDGKLETFHLQQQAMLRRTENGRVVDEVHGNEILYEARSEFFTVEGGSGANATPGNPSGRVRVVIQPRDENASSPSQPPAAGAPTPLKPDESLSVPRGGSR